MSYHSMTHKAMYILRHVTFMTIVQSILLTYLLIMTMDEISYIMLSRSDTLHPLDRLKLSLRYSNILVVPEIAIPIHSVIFLEKYMYLILGGNQGDE
jgi:hypothetical protein